MRRFVVWLMTRGDARSLARNNEWALRGERWQPRR